MHLISFSQQFTPLQRALFAWGFAVFVSLVVFAPGLAGAWWWDDNVKVFQHPFVVAPKGFFAIWSVGLSHDPWPLARSMYWLCYRYFEVDPFGYRVVQVLLHASVATGWGLVFHRLGFGKKGWVAAAVFLVHPITAETVLWVTEMTTLLAMLFALVSWWWFMDALERNGKAGTKAWGISLAWWAAALLSKAAVVGFPIAWGVWAVWVHRMAWRTVAVRLMPFMVLALASTGWTMATEGGISDPLLHRSPEGINRIAVAWGHVGFYVEKIVVPLNLSFMYPHSLDVQAGQPWLWGRWCAVSVVITGLIVWLRRETVLWGLGAGVAMLLAPVIGIVSIRHVVHTLVWDHFVYPAVPLVVLAVVWLAGRIGGGRVPTRLGWGVAGVILVVLTSMTLHRSWICGDPVRMWERETTLHPQLSPGWNMLAQAGLRPAWQQMGRLDQRFQIAKKREQALVAGRVSPSQVAEEQQWIRREVERIAELREQLLPVFELGRDRLDRCLGIQPGNFRARLVRARVRAVLGETEGLELEWMQAWTDMQRLPESGWDPGVARQVLGGLKHGKHVELAESVRTQARAVWPHHREFESE